MRQPTFSELRILRTEMENFESWKKFGKNRENTWRFSFSDRFFRKILVKLSISYVVLMDFDRKVEFSLYQSNEVSVSVRRTKELGAFFQARRAIKNKIKWREKLVYNN